MHRISALRVSLIGVVLMLPGLKGVLAAPFYSWQNVTLQAPYAARDGAGVVVFNNKAWLLGGWNSQTPVFPYTTTNEVWNSSDGRNWHLVKPNTFVPGRFNSATDWEGRHMAGWVVFQNKMWIVGGDSNQCHYQPNVWNSSDGVHWTQVATNVPWGNRVLHYTVVFDNKIWVMGGPTLTLEDCPGYTGSEKYYNDIWNSSDGVHWQQVKPVGPMWSPRGMICGSVVFNGRMWILGGGTYATQQAIYHDVWNSADGIHWTQVASSVPWQPVVYLSVAVYGGRIWILGGDTGDGGHDVNGVWSSPDGVHWDSAGNTPWLPRHAASAFAMNGGLWLTGGTTDVNGSQNDLWKLDNAAIVPLINSLLLK